MTEKQSLWRDEVEPTEPGCTEHQLELALASISERAIEIRDAEQQQALAALDARGDVTDPQQEAIEMLATTLVSNLLYPPTATAIRAAETGDEETIETLLTLFSAGSEELSHETVTGEWSESEPTAIANHQQDISQ